MGKLHHQIILIAVVLSSSGCCGRLSDTAFFPSDPSCICNAPPDPGDFWDPCVYIPRLTIPLKTLEELQIPSSIKELDPINLIDLALRNNAATRQAWADARAAAFEVGVQKSALYPTITGAEIYEISKGSGAFGGGGISSIVVPGSVTTPEQVIDIGGFGSGDDWLSYLTTELSIEYLLFDTGGRCASIESARQALYASNWLNNRILQDVAINVLQRYYGFIEIRARLEAAKDDLENARVTLESARARFNAGVGTKLDVLQAQTDYINVQLNIVDLQGQEKITLGELAASVGLPPELDIDISGFPEIVPMQESVQDVETLMDIARCQRPDLAAAQAEWLRRKADIRIAKSESLPTIDASIDLQRTDYFDSDVDSTYFLSGAITLNVPIFNGFLHWNRIRKQRELARSAYADWENQISNALVEVITAYYNFKTAVQTYKYAEDYVALAQEGYDVALGSYQAGVGTILDLLIAQRTLSDAKAQLISAKTGWLVSLANISYATGTLYSNRCL